MHAFRQIKEERSALTESYTGRRQDKCSDQPIRSTRIGLRVVFQLPGPSVRCDGTVCVAILREPCFSLVPCRHFELEGGERALQVHDGRGVEVLVVELVAELCWEDTLGKGGPRVLSC